MEFLETRIKNLIDVDLNFKIKHKNIKNSLKTHP